MHTEDTDTADDWLGIPTHEEMLRQHVLLVTAECEQMQQALAACRHSIAKLVEINQELNAQIDAIRAERDAARQDANHAHAECVSKENNKRWNGSVPTWGMTTSDPIP